MTNSEILSYMWTKFNVELPFISIFKVHYKKNIMYPTYWKYDLLENQIDVFVHAHGIMF